MTTIKINNDRNCYSRFCCRYRNNKYGEENAIKSVRVQVFIEHDEIDIYTVQYYLYRHQHRDHVTSCKQAVHADKEQGCAYK